MINKKRINIRIFAVIALSVILIGIFSGFGIAGIEATVTGFSQKDQALSAEESLQSFILSMREGNRALLNAQDNEAKEKIELAFASKTWENVSYTKIDGIPPMTKEIFLLADTNEIISKQDYDIRIQNNIKEICQKHSFNPEYLDYKGEELLKLTSEQMTMRNIIIQEISANSPVRIDTESAAPYQYFQLFFNGQEKSDEVGICNLRVVFVQLKDGWTFKGLYYDGTNVAEKEY